VARRNGQVFVTGNSGFPKSHDVSKALDKAAGAEREVVGTQVVNDIRGGNYGSSKGESYRTMEHTITAPATNAAKQWAGWGTALAPSWEPIVLARKPLRGTVAATVLEHGTGALNIDATRLSVAGDDAAYRRRSFRDWLADSGADVQPIVLDVLRHIAAGLRPCSTAGTAPEHGAFVQGGIPPWLATCVQKPLSRLFPSGRPCARDWSSILDFQGDCPACRRFCDEPLLQAARAAQASPPSLADALDDMCEALSKPGHSLDCQCIGRPSNSGAVFHTVAFLDLLYNYATYSAPPQGRWPPNVTLDEEAARLIDAQSGERPGMSGGGVHRPEASGGMFGAIDSAGTARCDTGGASRFFLRVPSDRCAYVPKASTAERNLGLGDEQNPHPTVKPLALMRWLVRLVTPPGETVLDPFCGSGSTGMAAVIERACFVGIEQDAESVRIAKLRIHHCEANPNEVADVRPADSRQPELF
jgi:hypothetical protein